MAKITGGAILVRSLLDQGASNVFTLSGNQILPIYDATIGTALRLIDVRHEGAAASMADAWPELPANRASVWSLEARAIRTRSPA